jgi:hypothetical protein
MRRLGVLLALAVILGSVTVPAAASPGQPERPRITITVLSGRPEHVTGATPWLASASLARSNWRP